MPSPDVSIVVNPTIAPAELFSFYQRNSICEQGFGQQVAARVLDHSDLIVAAFRGEHLVGFSRALFDGLSGYIVELCVDLECQGGTPRFGNGSLIESDDKGVGRAMGEALIGELFAMGAFFISAGEVLAGVEEDFYRSLGFALNEDSLEYIIDRRPYVIGDST
jgi:hypothetical protein